MERYGLFIDGEMVEGEAGRSFADRFPATGAVVAEVAEAGAADVDRAVRAAEAALRGPWGAMPPAERGAFLRRVADGIDARFEELVRAEVLDTGKPAAMARAIDVPRAAANLRAFADLATSPGTESFTQQTAAGDALHYSLRAPVGVVAVICPWNLPLLLTTWKVAPALAAGCTVVVKPSEETPATATLLAEIMRDAGIPKGVYNVIHGYGPGAAGEALAAHPAVRAVTFTGETRTGEAIMRTAAPHLKKLSFELGGKNPAIIFADADIDEAIAGTARSSFTNCGQVCLCSERVYVERPVFERFVDGLRSAAEALRPGDPFDERTTLGPLISAEHKEKVLGYLALAREEGAAVVTGGGAPELPGALAGGHFVQPTVWTGLSEGARVAREEVFGPVCHVRPFDTEAEALALANDTDYGLCAAIWTGDGRRAHRVAAGLEVGMVWVNTWFQRDLRTPFGGMKRSGIGREGGRHAMEFYSELKNVCVKL